MNHYESVCRSHRLDPPATFNFGRDVVDRFARDSNKIALIWCDAAGHERVLTFSDIARRSNQVANWLSAQGIGCGDRVIVMLPRIPEWQICLTACFKVGAVPIPCITMLTEKDVTYRVNHSQAIAVITVADQCPKFNDHLRVLRAKLVVDRSVTGWAGHEAIRRCKQNFDACDLGLEEPAIMYYTSGSTGDPKGVCHPARSLYAWRLSARHWLSLGPDDTMWCTADTGWSKAGTSILFGPWSQGSAVFFYDGPFEPRRRFELIERYAVTVFCAAATELRRLIREDISDIDISTLKLTVSAGESVNPEVLEAWQVLTGVPLLDGYGQTEILMTVLNYPWMPVKPGSMGRPLPGIETGLLRADGSLGGPGGQGELLIQLPSPQMMLGYWNDPERTEQALLRTANSQWFRTGDNVYQDGDGYFFYVGRTDDIISSAGYRIGPQEVENALIRHPAVQESAVVGIPDLERGEIVKAFVVLADPDAKSSRRDLVAELQNHVKQYTAPYKYPRSIEFIDELPKTVSGKIQRNLLRSRETTR